MKRPVINYVLETKRDNAQRIAMESITARISGGWYEIFNGKTKYLTFKVGLQCKIKPSSFGKIENKFKFDETVFLNYSKSNSGIKNKMQHLERQVDKVYSNFVLHDQNPTKDEFQQELNIQLNKTKREIKNKTTIREYLRAMISRLEIESNSGKKYAVKEGRIKTFRTLLYYIEKYETYFDTILSFDKLTEEIYADFWDFQDDILSGEKTLPKFDGKRKQQIKENGFTINGIIKYQKALLLTCRRAHKDKIDVAIDFNDPNLILDKQPTAKDIMIDEKNLLKVLNYQSDNADLISAKNYVILSALTGMRFESMALARHEKIEVHKDEEYNFKYIHSRQGKTSTECFIPLFPKALEILSAHDNKFPQFAENAIMNDRMKLLFKEAKIETIAEVTHYTFKRGIIKENKVVNELISSHDLRKSFYSNLSSLGVPQTIIEFITHPDKKETSMSNYYDKRRLLEKAIQFYKTVSKATNGQSSLYSYTD